MELLSTEQEFVRNSEEGAGVAYPLAPLFHQGMRNGVVGKNATGSAPSRGLYRKRDFAGTIEIVSQNPDSRARRWAV
jgi:hypothetical protein